MEAEGLDSSSGCSDLLVLFGGDGLALKRPEAFRDGLIEIDDEGGSR